MSARFTSSLQHGCTQVSWFKPDITACIRRDINYGVNPRQQKMQQPNEMKQKGTLENQNYHQWPFPDRKYIGIHLFCLQYAFLLLDAPKSHAMGLY